MSHQLSYESSQLLRVGRAYLLILSQHDLLEQLVGSIRPEGRLQHGHLVEDAPQRPDIAFEIIRFLVPHLRRGIVRRPRLRNSKLINQMFRDIEISYLGHFIMKENVCRFDVAMDDVRFMKLGQSFQNIIGHPPNLILRNPLPHSQRFLDAMLQVALVRALHHYAQHLLLLVVKGLLVIDHEL